MSDASTHAIMGHALGVDPFAALRDLRSTAGDGSSSHAVATAYVLALCGRFPEAVATLPDALAEVSGDPAVGDAVGAFVRVLCDAEMPGEAMLCPDPALGSVVGFLRADAAMAAGHVAAAAEIGEIAAGDDPRTVFEVGALIVHSRALCFLGRFEDARAGCVRAVERSPAWPLLRLAASSVSAFAAAHDGNRADIDAYGELLTVKLPDPRGYVAPAAYLLTALGHAAAGNPSAAAELLLRGTQPPIVGRLPVVFQAYAGDVIVEASLAAGDVRSARRWIDRTEALGIDGHPMAAAALARAKARLLLVENDHATSLRESAHSASRASQVGGELYVLRAQILSAIAETTSGRFAPSPRALDETAVLLASSRSETVRSWALGELHRLGRELRPLPAIGWDSLSAHQQIIARLAAQGMRNREIGATLFLSEKTVESHIAAILGALGASTRVSIGREIDLATGIGDFPERRDVSRLTTRQAEVAACVADGMSNAMIARALFISEKTVEKHVAALFERYGVHSRTAVAARFRMSSPQVDAQPNLDLSP